MSHSIAPISEIALPSRYDLLFPLASGGTASVHLGRLTGIAGFWRLVAIKAAHKHLTADPLYRDMMVEEASLASKIHHPNVVPVIDIADAAGRLLLVMDYIEGASIAELIGAAGPMSPRVAVRVALDACAGLHAAHTLSDTDGRSLSLVHRDVSPQNILVGTDGVARLTDFGIAKTAFAKGRSAVGTLKGKLAYMAPEYILGSPANARSDVFGLAVVVWEMLAGRRLFRGENGHETLCNVLQVEAPALSQTAPILGGQLDEVLQIALAKAPEERYRSAKAFGAALEAAAYRAGLLGTAEEVSAFVLGRVGDKLTERRRQIGAVVAAEHDTQEASSSISPSEREEITRRERALVPSNPPPDLEEHTVREGPGAVRAPEQPANQPPAELLAAFPRPPRMPSEVDPPEASTLEASEPPGVVDEVTAASPAAPPPPGRAVVARSEAPVAGSPWGRARVLRALALVASFALGGVVEVLWFSETSPSAAPPRPAASAPVPGQSPPVPSPPSPERGAVHVSCCE